MDPPTTLCDLPEELLFAIASNLRPQLIYILAQVNKTFRLLSESERFYALWEDLFMVGRGAAAGLDTEERVDLARAWVRSFDARLESAWARRQTAAPLQLKDNQMVVIMMRTGGGGLQPMEAGPFGLAVATRGESSISLLEEMTSSDQRRRSVLHFDSSSHLCAVLGGAKQVWLSGSRLAVPEGEPQRAPRVLLQQAPGSEPLLDALRGFGLLERSSDLFLETEAGTSMQGLPSATRRQDGRVLTRGRLSTIFSSSFEATWRGEQLLPHVCPTFPPLICAVWLERGNLMVATAAGTKRNITQDNLPVAVRLGQELIPLRTPRGSIPNIHPLGVGDQILPALEPFVTLPWSDKATEMASGAVSFVASPREGYRFTVRRSRDLAAFVPPT